jgi:NitT/TauT family transport system substrate-binding protein
MGMKSSWAKLSAIALLAGFVSSNASAADALSVQLNWTADTAHLGFAVAQVRGIYKKHDLDIKLVEGRGSAVAAQLVATGQADLAYADAVAALKVASQGAPLKIVSTVWKSGQFGILSIKDAGIQKPKDLIGKKLAVSPGSAMLPLIPVFLKANGIAEKDVEIISASENAFLGLMTTKQVDAVSQTPEKIAVPLSKQGIESNNMYFFDNGVPVASLSLVAREDRISEKGEAIKRFIQATAEGWVAAMQDPQGAVKDLKTAFPETENDPEALLQASVYSFASVCPGGKGDKIGVTDDATWSRMYSVMTTAMGLPAVKPVTNYYTNDLTPTTPVICP